MTDEKLYAAMTELYQEQQRCLALQRKLMFASVICFIVGFIPIVMNIAVTLIWGNRLENRASELVGYKYRFVLYAPYVVTTGGRKWLTQNPWRNEARRLGDDLVINLMDFQGTSFSYVARSILGLALMWMVTGIVRGMILKITGIDIYSYLP